MVQQMYRNHNEEDIITAKGHIIKMYKIILKFYHSQGLRGSAQSLYIGPPTSPAWSMLAIIVITSPNLSRI